MRVRVNGDGGTASPGTSASPAYGELVISDATGVVLTTPTSATVISGAPMAAGDSDTATVSLSTGGITIPRTGRYRVGFSAGNITGVNSQAITLEVYKDPNAVGSPAVLTNALSAKLTQPSTALAIVSLSAEGVVSLAKGDIIYLYGTASTGNLTIKQLRFRAVQLNDGNLALTV